MLTDAASKAVLVSAPEGLFVFDREGRIVFVNSQIDELFGYAPGELLGQSLEVLLPVLFWEMREQQSAASTPAPGLPIERYGLEQMGYCKNRAEILVQVSVSPVEAQDRPLECCIVRQIAAPEEQSQALNDSNDQFRQMVENSHDILTIRDADGRVRYISPSIHSVLGYKQEEMIGSTGFELLHPEDRSAVENARSEFWKNPGARRPRRGHQWTRHQPAQTGRSRQGSDDRRVAANSGQCEDSDGCSPYLRLLQENSRSRQLAANRGVHPRSLSGRVLAHHVPRMHRALVSGVLSKLAADHCLLGDGNGGGRRSISVGTAIERAPFLPTARTAKK